MAQIRIDFLAGIGWSSRLIEQFGFPQGWSHCASVLSDGRYLDSRDNAIAGVPAGVHIRQQSSEKWTRRCSATLPVTGAEYAYYETGLRAHLTTEYDEHAILGFLEGKSLHTAGDWICSALAINGVQHLSRTWTPTHLGYIPYPLPIPAHEISPDAALLILATAGFTINATLTAVQKEPLP
jgi:hypothetical protein